MKRFFYFLTIFLIAQVVYAQVVVPTSQASAIWMRASSYINWGNTRGTNGYGFRDNAGTPQVKSSGGSWSNITAASTFPLSIANGGSGAATQSAYTVFANPTSSTAAPTWTTTPVYKAGLGTEIFAEGGVIHTDTTAVGSTGGAGDVNALSYTLPANTLSANGQALNVNGSFVHAANTNTVSYYLRINTTSGLGSTCATSGGIGGFIIRVTRISSTVVHMLGTYNSCATLGRESTLVTVNDLGTMTNDFHFRINAATTTNDILTQSFNIAWIPVAP